MVGGKFLQMNFILEVVLGQKLRTGNNDSMVNNDLTGLYFKNRFAGENQLEGEL